MISKARERDERDLEWLRQQEAGKTAKEIGAPYGLTPEAVRVILNRIKNTMA